MTQDIVVRPSLPVFSQADGAVISRCVILSKVSNKKSPRKRVKRGVRRNILTVFRQSN